MTPLNVFENVMAWIRKQGGVVGIRIAAGVHASRINLRGHHVALIEEDEPGEARLLLGVRVRPLEKLVDVVEDQEIFEYRY